MRYRVIYREGIVFPWVTQKHIIIHAHDQQVECYADVMACRYVHDALDCAERLEDGREEFP